MPIYEYECKKCGFKFEELQKMSEEPLRTCPECNEAELVKLISNTSFQLKGTGWYATDFKTPAPKKEKESVEKEAKTKETTESKDTKSKDTDKK